MSQNRREVVFSDDAKQQINLAADWYAEQNPQVAVDWYVGIRTAITALETHAERYPVARENDDFPYELRQIPYGLGKRITHRVLYEIQGDDRVVIHQVRHVAQRDISPDD